jgi:hypothetical protein
MLDWKNLTIRQRAVCMLLSLLVLAGSIITQLASVVSPVSVLEGVAVVLLFTSLLLNPNFVRGDLASSGGYMKQLFGKPFPRLCKSLAIAALVSLMLSRAASVGW